MGKFSIEHCNDEQNSLAEEMPLETILAGFEEVYAEVYKVPGTFFVPHIGFYQRVETPNRYLAKDFCVFP